MKPSEAQQSRLKQSRAEQRHAERSRAEQRRTEQSRAEQSRAERSRAEQGREEQGRAQHSRAKQNQSVEESRATQSKAQQNRNTQSKPFVRSDKTNLEKLEFFWRNIFLRVVGGLGATGHSHKGTAASVVSSRGNLLCCACDARLIECYSLSANHTLSPSLVVGVRISATGYSSIS